MSSEGREFPNSRNQNPTEAKERDKRVRWGPRYPIRPRSGDQSSSDEGKSVEGADDDDSEDDDDDDSSSAPTEDEEKENDQIKAPPPPRKVNTPMDRDGNPLSFSIDMKWWNHPNSNQVSGNKGEQPTKPQDVRDTNTMESIKILKAISVTSEGRTTVELHTFPGPENPTTAEAVDLRWYHLHGDQLDFAQFKVRIFLQLAARGLC